MAKTSLALDLTRHVAVEIKRPVGVFSSKCAATSSASSSAPPRRRRLAQPPHGHLSSRQWRDVVAATRRMTSAPLFLDYSRA